MAENIIDTDSEEDKFLNSDEVISIVNLLHKFNIKLWEMKVFNDMSQDAANEDLILKISDESGLVENKVSVILAKLQKHSVNKLENNRRFRAEGIASFKLKVVGNSNKNLPRSFNKNIELAINSTGRELKEFIIKDSNLDCSGLKLICNGKVICEDMLLSSQNIKNHSTLMAMCIYEQKIDGMVKNSADQKLISDIKDAVGFLNEEKLKLNETSSKAEFKVKNQNGISLDISHSDTNCLTIAMILHEKAKTSINSKDYLKALILLAEADNEFKNCQDKFLLEKVDNYALLNLDIIWCYLNLGNLHELKNAEERLDECEKCLKKCYGSDMERLTLLKNESAQKHIPIFVRLNLFKGILNYHRGRKRDARQFLDIANEKLSKVTIDEEKIMQIMSMGFSSIEARLALRASLNDVDVAVENIFKKKQRKKEAEESELSRNLEKEFGRTLGDKPIDIKVLRDLKQLGYTKSQAAKALIKANNDFDLALGLLSSNPEFELNENIEKLVAMGYSEELCRLCLKAFGNELQKCIDYFCEKKLLWTDLKNDLEEKIRSTDEDEYNEPTTSKASEEKAKNAIKIYEDLAQEMSKDDEAYLDFNLNEDAFYINKYYSLLS